MKRKVPDRVAYCNGTEWGMARINITKELGVDSVLECVSTSESIM